jgi:uncharacterized caspase-like protein
MRHARILPVFAAFFALVLLAWDTAHAATGEKRVALVIGNSAYKHTTKLKNPVRDAQAVSAALKRLGFDVVEGYDLDMSGMRAQVREFTTRIREADVSLFYYAGHGFQINGQNHLAPVDARLKRESDVDFETVSLNLVLRQMEREKRTNLVFLDACRDNPLANQLARSVKGRSLGATRGLATVDSGVGMMISYATSPGMVAFDGQGKHSPYTNALLKHIEKPGLSVNDMMIAVRQDVLAESKGKQIPWEHSSLTGKYYFQTPVKTAARSDAPAAPIVAAAPGVSQEAVASAYRATVGIGTCGAYRIFAEQHGGTFYGRLADEYLRTKCAQDARQISVEPRNPVPEAKTEPEQEPVQVASAEPAAPVEPEEKEKIAEPDLGPLVTAIQTELNRLGCSAGRADGDWGRRTRQAVANFNRQAKSKLSVDGPSDETLAALKAKTGKVCVAAAPVQRKTTTAAPDRKKSGSSKKKDEVWGGASTIADCQRGAWTLECFHVKDLNRER